MKGMTTILTLSLLATVSHATWADDTPHSAIARDMKVFGQVLESVANDTQPRSHVRVTADYLEHQGVLFTVRLRSDRVFAWRSHPGFIPEAPRPPEDGAPDVGPEIIKNVEIVEANAGDEDGMAPPLPPANDPALEKMKEKRRQLMDKRRALHEKLRSLESKADHDPANNPDIRKLQEQLQQLREELGQLMKEHRQRMMTMKKEKVQATNTRRAKMVESILSGMCEYAPAMRHLPSDQYITLKFSGARIGQAGPENHYVVLKTRDLQRCQKNRWSGDQLLKNVTHYFL
jgi:Holliday junction resolvasome RuvABC endonuclease subunit